MKQCSHNKRGRGKVKEQQSTALTRSRFMKKAKAFETKIGEKAIAVKPRIFSTGSSGFSASEKIEMKIGSRRLMVQTQITCTVIGSKAWDEN